MRPPPKQKNIRDFEMKFGLKLPPLYLQLLMHANGGHPELNSYVNSLNGKGTAIDHLYHLSDDKSSYNSIWRIASDYRKYISRSALAFAENGGGDMIALDVEMLNNPVSIHYGDNNFKGVFLSDSFEEFIDGLKIDPEMI